MSRPETTRRWSPDAQLTRYVASGQVVGRVLNSKRSTDPPQHGQQSPSASALVRLAGAVMSPAFPRKTGVAKSARTFRQRGPGRKASPKPEGLSCGGA